MPTYDTNANLLETPTYFEVDNLSAGSNGAKLLTLMDVSAWGRFSLHVYGVWTGTLTVQAGDTGDPLKDNFTTYIQRQDTLAMLASINNNGIYVAPINSRWLQITLTPYTSGTAQAILELFANPTIPLPGYLQFFNAGGLIAALYDGGGQLQSSMYGKNSVAGDTPIKVGSSGSVFTNLQSQSATTIVGSVGNDGVTNGTIAAGKATDTVIKGSAGRLVRVLVTTAGTTELDIYDNASVGSGTLIGLIPAGATVTGVPYVFNWPAANGITVKGNAGNPAISYSYV